MGVIQNFGSIGKVGSGRACKLCLMAGMQRNDFGHCGDKGHNNGNDGGLVGLLVSNGSRSHQIAVNEDGEACAIIARMSQDGTGRFGWDRSARLQPMVKEPLRHG